MGLPRTATLDEIKRQYKKLALKYHPDRNINEVEEATRMFKEISTAYSVLSDPHEKQWYDDHRESILRGGNGTTSTDDHSNDNIVDVWKYFQSSCYSGIHDDSGGFFEVYRTLFDSILQKEQEQRNDIHSNKAFSTESISFGVLNSSNETVLKFYSYWENFVTIHSFSWEDAYNILEAPNRQVKRAMEKENQKLRDAAKKEYTNQIRALASFVKKRDVRFERIESEMKQKKSEDEKRRTAMKNEALEKKKQIREELLKKANEDENERVEREKEHEKSFRLADEEEEDDDGMDRREADRKGRKAMKMKPSLRKGMKGVDEDAEEREEEYLQNMLKDLQVVQETERIDEDVQEGREDRGLMEAIYRCVVCSKEFRSNEQYQQHASSKVHRKKVQEVEKMAKKSKPMKEKTLKDVLEEEDK